MKTIITGGAGFIGSHAVDHFLDCGDTVSVIDSLTYAANVFNVNANRHAFHRVDIADEDRVRWIVSNEKPDVIVNFAAETHVDNSIADSEAFVRTNVGGVVSLLNVIKDTKTKLCHVSTDEVYGPAGDRAFSEDDKLNPMNPYSATKASGDLLIKAYANTYNVDYIIVRPSNNYGPRQHAEKLVPKLLHCIQNNQKFPVYGDGRQEREWTYVKDTVAIIRKCIVNERTWRSTYNVTSNTMKTNVDMIRHIIDVYNSLHLTQHTLENIVDYVKDRPGHDKKYWIVGSLPFEHTYTGFFEAVGSTVLHFTGANT